MLSGFGFELNTFASGICIFTFSPSTFTSNFELSMPSVTIIMQKIQQ